ncbi:hypothetical protein AB0O64_16130 [Streptomyces sp. NPDC088341]|uniref:hypothetical protein n=1 Tax=Streptomyces sp. NPDC088341 TaxID=3154870 RepID=UPI00341A38FE
MRISTDDGRFGLILTPAGDPWDARFFRFQLIVDSVIMGDSEPCVLGSMMLTLQNMARLEDPRLARPDADPAATLSVLRSDAALNDPSLLGAAESLDHCLVHGYVHGTNAIVIGKPAEPSAGTRTPHVAVVSLHDFQAIVTAAARYWEEVQRDAQLNIPNQ